MKKYIIKINIKLQGKWHIAYHDTIGDTKDGYVEHISTDIKKAKKFEDKQHAKLIAKLFSSEMQINKVIEMK